ncbi:hypothetical protein E4U41_003786 [Claviceps citrina]|nr:hypothetical protein E4U41_003786 [Claviceps citrina]
MSQPQDVDKQNGGSYGAVEISVREHGLFGTAVFDISQARISRRLVSSLLRTRLALGWAVLVCRRD